MIFKANILSANACQNSPCQNSGVCISNDDENTPYICQCLPGTSGSICQFNTTTTTTTTTTVSTTLANPCASYPCLNNGICVPTGTNTYYCQCVNNYTGPRCATLNVCASLTCQNGGTCLVSTAGTAYCSCALGYTGVYCQTCNSLRKRYFLNNYSIS